MFALREKQPGDQKAADDKKHEDAKMTELKNARRLASVPGVRERHRIEHCHVTKDDHQDGNGAQSVE